MPPTAIQTPSAPHPTTTATPSRPIPKERGKNLEASFSEDEDMTAREQLELNVDLASLGIPPMKMPSIAIDVVYNEDIPGEARRDAPIHIPSDSEEGNAREDALTQTATDGEGIEEET